MPVGPSRVSEDRPTDPGDTRAEGFAPEKGDPSDTSGDRVDLSVNEYPYQEGSEAFLRLTIYDPKLSVNGVEWSFAGPDQRVAQYSVSGDDWHDKYDSANDTNVRVSQNQGFSWEEWPVVTPASDTETKSIKFARQAEAPSVDNASFNPGTAWQDEPPSDDGTRLWAVEGVVDTANSQIVENWSDPFELLGLEETEGTVVQYAEDDGSGNPTNWSNTYDSSIHVFSRVSRDGGYTWTVYEITTPNTTDSKSIKFARGDSKPAVDNDSYSPGPAWNESPPSGSEPLHVITGRVDETNGQIVQNWTDPQEATPKTGQWREILFDPEDGNPGATQQVQYLISLPFSEVTRQPPKFTLYWRVHYSDSMHRGRHQYDRDEVPEFEPSLFVEGNDLRLELDGDEDVASYVVGVNKTEQSFPDQGKGTYYEGQNFKEERALNLGRLSEGEYAYVTVTSYETKEQNEGQGNPKRAGTVRNLILQRPQDDPVPQVRFAGSADGPYYDEFDTGRTWMQISRDRGLNWTAAIDISGEKAAQAGETRKAYYFQRSIGAPDLDPNADAPGPNWNDVPTVGTDPLWVTTAPVDENGDAVDKWATPYVVVGEVPPLTLPPDRAYAEFSDKRSGGTWLETYSDTSPDHEYVRIRWTPGQDWQVVDMVEDDTGGEKPINRFTRSNGEPSIGGDQSKYDGPDSKWSDLPTVGSKPLWMISALADLDNDTLVGGSDGQWSDPIRLVPPTANKTTIEFGVAPEGGFSPLYDKDETHYHISTNYGDSWEKTKPLSGAYFAEQDAKPSQPSNDPPGSPWQKNPPVGEPSGQDLWITTDHDGDGTWSEPERVYRDAVPRGPEDADVFVQYSADKISWHNNFRQGDKWMRQRIAPGIYTDPIRIVGETGEGKRFFFKAHDDAEVAPEIDSTIPDYDSTVSYAKGDRVQYDGDGTWEFWEATTSNSGVTPSTSASEWDNVDPHTFDPDSQWVNGPSQALSNGGPSEGYVWSISARFNAKGDRQTKWDGPFRVNGENRGTNPRGEIEVVEANRSGNEIERPQYFVYRPNDISKISSVEVRIQPGRLPDDKGNYPGSKSLTTVSQYQEPVGFNTSSDEVDIFGYHVPFLKGESTVELTGGTDSTDDGTYEIKNLRFDPTGAETYVELKYDIQSGFDIDTLKGDFYVERIAPKQQTVRQVEVRIHFTDQDIPYEELITVAPVKGSSKIAKDDGTDKVSLQERTDLVDQQVVFAQGLDSQSDDEGGTFYVDLDSTATTDGQNIIELLNLPTPSSSKGRLIRLGLNSGGAVTSFGGRTGDVVLKKSDTTGVVINQLEATYPGSVPADTLLMQHVFHGKFHVVEAIIYAENAPDTNTYNMDAIFPANTYALDLPAGSNQNTVSIGETLTKGEVLRVITQSTADQSMSDLTVSFKMNSVA